LSRIISHPAAGPAVLVVYATTEGQTRKIAAFIADWIAERGGRPTLADASLLASAVDLSDFDAAVVAALLHAGRYQPSIVGFLSRRCDALGGMQTGFVSVSLSAASRDHGDIEGLTKCLERFEAATGWRPRAVHHAAGAFRYTRYGFLKRWALRYIAWRKGQPTDTSRDYELTDWAGLGVFVDGFMASVLDQRGGARLRR
jgi:menaquinone-dependent protoporphyrinogen oxidase